jgi:hypothetical protein
MNKIINITIDPTIINKTKKNIISCLKDHKLESCIGKNHVKHDIFITNIIENIDQIGNYNILLCKDEKNTNTTIKNSTNVICISDDDIESLINFIDLANEKKFHSLLEKVKNDTRPFLEQVIKAGNSYLSRIQKRIVLDNIDQDILSNEIDEFLIMQKVILQVSIDSSLYENEQRFISFLEKSVKSLKLIKELNILDEEELNDKVPLSNDDIILPYPDKENTYLHVKLYTNSDIDRSNFMLSSLYIELENFQFQKNRINDVQTVNELWSTAFLNLPSPVALFTENGELLLHNTLFTNLKILPKDCLNLKNGEKIDLEKNIYRVLNKSIHLGDAHFSIYFFNSVSKDKERGNISSEELGIISSSIAHELNNPIAGILASISLLELEDSLCKETISSIKEMKHSAKRCQELIKVFLGFSKASPTKNVDTSMYSSFKHALELLRFRMIESQLRMEVGPVTEKIIFVANGNSSVRAMIFYLILNEVLSFYSQNNLISSEVQNLAKCNFKEEAELIHISFSISIEKATSILTSKLINHLLSLENLELKLTNNQLIISQNAVRLLL